MLRAFAAMIAVVCFGCQSLGDGNGGNGGTGRLIEVNTEPDGTVIWYDSELGEECRAYDTEYNSTRCFPKFTRIFGDQVRYRDSVCSELIAWTDLDSHQDKYVAVVGNAESEDPIVYSIFRVFERHYVGSEPSKYVETFRFDDSGCAALPKELDRTYVDIGTRIHPDAFAAIE